MSSEVLRQVRCVMVRPRLPANIGAAARAWKAMGLRQIVLVDPPQDWIGGARVLACHAEDLLAQAQVVSSLAAAIDDCVLSVATSRRIRTANWPVVDPAQAASELLRAGAAGPVALVFGPEDSGLSNEELCQCRLQATIDTDPECGSLNLAQTVQLMAWELRRAHHAPAENAGSPPATEAELRALWRTLREAVQRAGLRDDNPEHAMRPIQRLVNRALPTGTEVGLLHALLRRLLD